MTEFALQMIIGLLIGFSIPVVILVIVRIVIKVGRFFMSIDYYDSLKKVVAGHSGERYVLLNYNTIVTLMQLTDNISIEVDAEYDFVKYIYYNNKTCMAPAIIIPETLLDYIRFNIFVRNDKYLEIGQSQKDLQQIISDIECAKERHVKESEKLLSSVHVHKP